MTNSIAFFDGMMVSILLLVVALILGILFRINFGGNMSKAQVTLTFNISPAPEPITEAKTVFADQVGQSINDSVGLSGGVAPLSLTVDDPNTLPPGVSVATDGTVSGTPTAAGTFTVPVTITDAQG